MTFSLPHRLLIALAVLLLSLGCCNTSFATDFPTRKVTVTGTATIKVVPDQMTWTVSITINDATLAKAKARHDESLADALKFIKYVGGNAIQDLQTGGIRFEKQTYFPDGADRSQPFSCSTSITFTLTDFDKYGALCDGLAKLDGAQISSVDYASSKAEATKREALKQALLNAHDKANDLAVAGGCYIDKPLEIQEGAGDGPRPMLMAATFRSGGGTPPPVAGQIEISATVTATYDMFYR